PTIYRNETAIAVNRIAFAVLRTEPHLRYLIFKTCGYRKQQSIAARMMRLNSTRKWNI
ncbi:unnamed protein product, partial [Prunus brigantina]